MLKINSNSNGFTVEGVNNGQYPENGLLTFPSNSVVLVMAEDSDMITFKSAANFDTLFSGLVKNITVNGEAVTKDNINEKFSNVANASTGGGGGGGTVIIKDLYKIVQTLPNTGDINVIYLVPKVNKEEVDGYDEYLYVNGKWELIGTVNADINLTDYYTKDEVNILVEALADAQAEDLAKITELQGKLNGVQNLSEELAKKANKDEVYTTGEINNMFLSKELEINSVRGDVENALGEIAALEFDKANKNEVNEKFGELEQHIQTVQGELDGKQQKLSANYIANMEQNGGYIKFILRNFDTLISSEKTVDFKTINGQSIIGQGDISIQGGGGSIDTSKFIEALELQSTGNTEIVSKLNSGWVGLLKYKLGGYYKYFTFTRDGIDNTTMPYNLIGVPYQTGADIKVLKYTLTQSGNLTKTGEIVFSNFIETVPVQYGTYDTNATLYQKLESGWKGLAKLDDEKCVFMFGAKNPGSGEYIFATYPYYEDNILKISKYSLNSSGNFKWVKTITIPEDFKTINGETIIGTGNIEVPTKDDFYTKEEVDKKIAEGGGSTSGYNQVVISADDFNALGTYDDNTLYFVYGEDEPKAKTTFALSDATKVEIDNGTDTLSSNDVAPYADTLFQVTVGDEIKNVESGTFMNAPLLNKVTFVAEVPPTIGSNAIPEKVNIDVPNIDNYSQFFTEEQKSMLSLDYSKFGGRNIVNHPYYNQYYTIEVLPGANAVIMGTPYERQYQARINGGNWENITQDWQFRSFTPGTKIELRSVEDYEYVDQYSSWFESPMMFDSNQGTEIKIYGNINTIFVGENAFNIDYPAKYPYQGGIIMQEVVKDALNLVLPNECTMPGHCRGLFQSQNKLEVAPAVFPSVKISGDAYADMFNYCQALQIGPQYIFAEEVLEDVRQENSEDGAMEHMFYQSAVVKAPAILIKKPTKRCFASMFSNCMPMYREFHAEDLSAQDCTYNMNGMNGGFGFDDMIFVKKKGVEWPMGENGIPTGCTVIEI